MDKTMKIDMDEMENMIDKKRNENNNEMKINMDKMENKIDKKMDDIKNKMDDMTNKMDENIQKSMKELEKSLSSMMFHALDDRLSKGDIKIQGTQENKGSIMVEQPTDNKQFSSGFKSNSGVNYGGGPKFNFPKIELKKFDGT